MGLKIAFLHLWYNRDRWLDNAPASEPVLGRYDSRDQDTIRVQLAVLKWAGFDGVAAQWWGHEYDDAFGKVLHEARNLGLRVVTLYEPDIDGREAEYRADLEILSQVMRWGGQRRTLFAFQTWSNDVSQKARLWSPAEWEIVTQGVGGHSRFAYDMTVPWTFIDGQCFNFSPGYDPQDREAEPLPRVDPEYFRAVAQYANAAASAGRVRWVTTSANEHPERTAVEPCDGDNGAYIQAIRAAFRP